MKIRALLSLLSLASLSFLSIITSTGIVQNSHALEPLPKSSAEARVAGDFGRVPLSFEVNQGQSDSSVRFLSHGNGYSFFLTDSSAVLLLLKSERKSKLPGHNSAAGDVIRMEISGINSHPKVSGSDQLPGKTNYFIGNDPAKWRLAVPTYAKVRYADIYPGVDLVYYGNQRQLEYDFVVAPHADAKPVRLHFSGIQHLSLTAGGDLTVKGKNGKIAFHKPVVYQVKNGVREPVQGRFKILARNNVGFNLRSYDRTRELVIDPVLGYSTYLGGSVWDYGNAIAVDATGDAYVVGFTGSPDFPVTAGAFQTVVGLYDKGTAFVTKFNPRGSALIYSTFLGGTLIDNEPGGVGDGAWGVAVDSAGNAYVTGQAASHDFPVTPGAFQTVNNNAVDNQSGIMNTNAFVTKLNPTGSALVYSTYLGGTGNQYPSIGYYGDAAAGIAIDSDGNAYVAGNTVSFDFPVTANAFQKTNNAAVAPGMYGPGTGYCGFNFFITKLKPTGSGLVYSTYLGGSGGYPYSIPGVFDHIGGIAIDSDGNAYVAGNTYSANYPVTLGAFQTASKAHSNVVVTKLNPAGSALVYSTYLGGGSGYLSPQGAFYGDSAGGIAVDSAGNTYITGTTYSLNFPVTLDAFQTVNHANSNGGANAFNAFITKVNPAGSGLVYSTYLGGSCCDSGNAIALDAFGSTYITGASGSTNFPVTSDAFQKANYAPSTSGLGASNVIFSRLDPTGSSLLYSSYLGGSGSNSGNGIAVDQFGNAYITGLAGSSYFPLAGTPFQTFDASYEASAFVSKFFVNTVTGTALTSDGNPQKQGVFVTFRAHVTPNTGTTIPTGTVTFSINGNPQTTVSLDDTGHASLSTSSLTAGRYDITAAYSGTLTVSASSGSLGQTIIGPPARITVGSGSKQTGVVGTPFAMPLVVQVQDFRGVPVPGAVIDFSGAGLSFTGNPAVTNASGQASVVATPTAAGALTASASVAGVATPATYKLTSTQPGP